MKMRTPDEAWLSCVSLLFFTFVALCDCQAGDLTRLSRVFTVTSYGADPSGMMDSTSAIETAITQAFNGTAKGGLMPGVADHGGVRIDLEGGTYVINKPLRFPNGTGNFQISGGTLIAADDFPSDRHLIELTSSSLEYNHEYVTLRDLLLDSNFSGGGILVNHSLRTTIDNCYITQFTTTGILVEGGHETYIRNGYLGQHITAGRHPNEANFTGTGISLMGNDNAVTDVVIFSAGVGILITGQGNAISGVHCYNKATGFGGVGILIQAGFWTQTRIINCYLDYTGIVVEDPFQVTISNCFFLGGASISLKAVKGIAHGVTIVDNIFSGNTKGKIVTLDGTFPQVNSVVVERNEINGMKAVSTRATNVVQGKKKRWTADFNDVLLFPNSPQHVQCSFMTNGTGFPRHVIRNVSQNVVVVETDVAVRGTLYVTVVQAEDW